MEFESQRIHAHNSPKVQIPHHICTPAHLHIFTSHIFTSVHIQTCSSSHLHFSLSLSLSFLGGTRPPRHVATFPTRATRPPEVARSEGQVSKAARGAHKPSKTWFSLAKSLVFVCENLCFSWFGSGPWSTGGECRS